MYTFPKNFIWGAATSGPQSEGNFKKRHQNVFDYWYTKDPSAFYAGVGPDTTSNFYNDYENDLKLMHQAGIKALRTSIQWSRLIADFETCEVDQKGADFYSRVIDAMLANGITPYINLCHFDMPVELQHKYGGFESKHVTDLFAGFAKKCFELYGDRVDHWFTFNEPKVILDGGYLYQFHYPLKVDGPLAVQVAYNLNLASAKAIKAFRELYGQDKSKKIGTILNLTPAYPASDSPKDQAAAEFAELWANKMFLEPAVLGHYPQKLVEILERDGVLWEQTPAELQLLKEQTVDVLGVNFYHPFRVKAPAVSPASLQPWMPDIYFDEYEMPGRVMNVDKGWEIYPKALYDIAVNIRDNYNNIEWFVSENGMGVSSEERFMDKNGVVCDDYRIEFMKKHLKALHRGIKAGSNCHGYFVWTGIDCWSWKNAYRNRYGLIRDDIHTQIKTLKKSGHWFNELSNKNSFE
ncbi:glycoside hydrolase family 1 protein [Ligilactobacillus murinus]|uniref:Glycoside hydrolase family 1 protein n=1 Tax=Ligilactobacillus murinus TaxID=1622 RepID=A0A4Q2AX09_9LACO|nr:glycoside hydrolase family 1 protein [Ligilactobacillus murinus]NBH85807.1 glycoside hydrolase family 1 protein [Lachnospiraceae bacterium]MBF0702063.1 glycoside hydrolase family 1 protein [Ligilactobacillus murinus]MCR1881056.1 glycoside hydrolase family 1 protein [Ligilactobacillus murinus]MCR1896106.1 glycoside hydrolase family 1 protein [Ligilactobacillus murinus]MCZ0674486.1 glycoside hydrolase family 1 protein [Ligilactobacillus murinus]